MADSKQAQYAKVIAECLETERRYLEDLSIIAKVFLIKICIANHSPDLPQTANGFVAAWRRPTLEDLLGISSFPSLLLFRMLVIF